MYLKSLTIKGFKSFASPTTLNFEPGVTCVVGPNGSGKSNVVDALTWVMGEQGAKSLRGGKMQDVIFAGTSRRPALGRAEVSLTIDNSDQALPIDYTEVTISRILFRTGGSDYAINGTPCRLLDVQELLSDSGIGREMHVIVGQGQLDSILHATPEDRRGFVEEAAGVLKHRKRKEKALRKLDGLGDKLSRLTDLTSELRRQLKPLGRQAEVARRAVVIQSDVRDAKLRLLADDLSSLQRQLAEEQADEVALKQRRGEVEAQVLADRAAEAALLAEAEPQDARLAGAQRVWVDLSGLVERFRSVASLAAERSGNLSAQARDVRRGGVDPADLDRQAEQLAARGEELASSVRDRGQELAERSAERSAVEAELAEEEQRVEAAARAASAGRERIARLNGQVVAARSRLEARLAEVAALEESLGSRRDRVAAAEAKFAELQRTVAELDTGEVDLDGRYEESRAKHAELVARLEQLRGEHTDLSHRLGAVRARTEALGAGLVSRSETPGFVAGTPGIGAGVAELLQVEPGMEKAVTAVLAEYATALVADDLAAAESVLDRLRSEGGSARLVIAGRPATAGDTDRVDNADSLDGGADPGRRSLKSVVQVPGHLRPAIEPLLAGTVVVADVAAARDALAGGAARAVTITGELVSPTLVSGGETDGVTVLELAAQLDAAQRDEQRLQQDLEELDRRIEELAGQTENAKLRSDEALAALHASDAKLTAAADGLGALGSALKSDQVELARNESALREAAGSVAADRTALEAAELKLREAELAQHEVAEPDSRTDRRAVLSERAAELRAAEMENRLALRTDEERLRVLQSRVKQLHESAVAERRAAAEWQQRRDRSARQAAVAEAVRTAAGIGLETAQRLRDAADAERLAGERRRTEREQRLSGLRARLGSNVAELEQLTDSVHRDEMARTEQRVRIQQIVDKAMEDFGVDADSLVAEYGPEVPVPPSLRAPGDAEDGEPDAEPYPYVRREQERRLRSAERAMKLLGKVNPLALEEFAAMEERYQFLSEQVADLKSSRADLEAIIAGVDERVEQVFAEAFADTAREFEQVFARLFPGGEGRLVLTDPGDMLRTGIEVEARPPGKKIKRLSLLSGGERSLTAVAFLVALFKARPSPFYVLDEVEAALDDVNLGRLLDVIDELRESSQLIVVTHQKRTMEAADALYGVTMAGDGVSQVISQRIREPESVS